ncbi:MAG TPA: hypothetical protein VF601_23165 [Beijerinckiaceae bacterium]|jgi:hypothetical protein
MEISFATEDLKKACLARDLQAGNLPKSVLAALHTFYNAMRNAEHVEELPLGKPEPGELNEDLAWRIDLREGYKVVVRVNHSKPPLIEGSMDWTRVYRLQVIAIEPPHA